MTPLSVEVRQNSARYLNHAASETPWKWYILPVSSVHIAVVWSLRSGASHNKEAGSHWSWPYRRRLTATPITRLTSVPGTLYQAAVGTGGDGGDMVVFRVERAAVQVAGDIHISAGTQVSYTRIGSFVNIRWNVLADVRLVPLERWFAKRLGGGHLSYDHSKPNQPITIFGKRSYSVGRTQVLKRSSVAAAATNLYISCCASDRVHLVARLVGAIPVIAPFFDVAVHIKQSPGVGRTVADVQKDGVGTILCCILLLVTFAAIAGVIPCGGAGPAGILPFGFRRQTISPCLFGREPFTEVVGIFPAYHDDGFIGSA